MLTCGGGRDGSTIGLRLLSLFAAETVIHNRSTTLFRTWSPLFGYSVNFVDYNGYISQIVNLKYIIYILYYFGS